MNLHGKEREPAPEYQEAIIPAEVVFVTEEIPTPPACFEAYLLRRLGRLPEKGQYHLLPTLNPQKGTIPEEFLLISPNGQSRDVWIDFIDKIDRKEGGLSGQERHILSRMANYFQICVFSPERRQKLRLGDEIGPNIQKKRVPHETLVTKFGASTRLYHLLLDQSLKFPNQPQEALEAGIKQLEDWVEKGIDPFKYGKVEIAEVRKRSRKAHEAWSDSGSELRRLHVLADHGPEISFAIPILQKEPGQPITIGETRIVDEITLKRNLEILRFLEGKKISIAIVGPPNSGKSTLTASLVVEVNRLINEAKTYQDPNFGNFPFKDLNLRCHFMDLDKSTPDVAAILEGEFDRRKKAKWTIDGALSTAKEFIGVEGNIIFADAPGGHPDQITQIVIGPADIAILLIGAGSDTEWIEQRNAWRDVLREMGISPLVFLRSRLPGEISQVTGQEIDSSITSFFRADKKEKTKRDWVRRVGGRVVGLERQVVTDDPCISVLAKLLLFDLIPLVCYERERRKSEYLNRLAMGYTIEKVYPSIK